jgi:hypothetical protein
MLIHTPVRSAGQPEYRDSQMSWVLATCHPILAIGWRGEQRDNDRLRHHEKLIWSMPNEVWRNCVNTGSLISGASTATDGMCLHARPIWRTARHAMMNPMSMADSGDSADHPTLCTLVPRLQMNRWHAPPPMGYKRWTTTLYEDDEHITRTPSRNHPIAKFHTWASRDSIKLRT